MAEIASKSAVFSPISHHQNHNHKKSQICPISCSIVVKNQNNFVGFSSLKTDFIGSRIAIVRDDDYTWSYKRGKSQSIDAKMGLSIGKAQKWWEKGLQPNMKEITYAEELVSSLLKAGDQLVVVDFFSPGCGGCKALHPKVCQLAQMNPDVQFLHVNYEEHKSMCYSLNVHVLPFFRFYRGSEGRVCSFSCTNATIKKFKDALAKYSAPRCSLGPPKGLEEKELLALAANKDLSLTYTPKPVNREPNPVYQEAEAKGAGEAPSPCNPSTTTNSSRDSEDRTLVSAGR
ncbi:thioredoxin-like 1-1, chloroplastic [Silene latifolia]|uniref:thioredoxin-like 1-1, chloroplastic n=1 Tax=Silene latifolia TaxID=37657 RepID=UPI003D78B1AD